MAKLQADYINEEFLKNFLTETIYVVVGEMHTPVQADEPSTVAPVELVANAAEEKPAALRNQITEHKPVATPVIPHLPVSAGPVKYKIAGTNDKGVAILVTLPEEEFNKLPQLSFLQKILYAIGLKATDVAYVNNLSGATAKFEDLQQELQLSYIISFASRLDTELPHEKFTLYNPVLVGDVPVVFSQSLTKLQNDVEQKKLLWNALRQIFL